MPTCGLRLLSAGTFFIGVSNANNTLYNANTGNGDVGGGANATGSYQLIVQALPVDTDDSLLESFSLGAISTTPAIANGTIFPDIDVDLYRFTVAAGQVVDFDIDTPFNGPGGLGSYLRLFNSLGQEIAFNNNAAAPGETVIGFDAYLRFTFATAGTYLHWRLEFQQHAVRSDHRRRRCGGRFQLDRRLPADRANSGGRSRRSGRHAHRGGAAASHFADSPSC